MIPLMGMTRRFVSRIAAISVILGAGAHAAAGPQQISLALTEAGPTEMAVMWISLDPWNQTSQGSVTWSSVSHASGAQAYTSQSAPATTFTYTAGAHL